jgi:type VI secretion system secreted protein VgrG
MTLTTDVLPPVDYQFRAGLECAPWLVREAEIREALSGDYRADIDLESDDPLAHPEDLLGASATLTLSRPIPEVPLRNWSGIVRAVDEPWGLDLAGRRRCRITLEPAFVCLKEERLTRKFQLMTVPEVIDAVLADFALAFQRDFELRLQRTAESGSSGRGFATRDLCVQYAETTFDFLRRIMAEEGLTYFFEQGENRETLVIVDDNTGFPEAPDDVPLVALHGSDTWREAVHSVALTHERSAGRAEVRAFNPTQHRTIVAAQPGGDEPGRPARGDAEIYLAGPALTLFGFDESRQAYERDDGAVQASLALQRSEAGATIARATSDVIGLAPGLVVALDAEEGVDLPPIDRFLLVAVHHRGGNPERLVDGTEQARPYSNALTCIPAATPFRPALVPKPTAVEDWGWVVSRLEGDPIDTDLHGRVRVRFGYDRDETAPAEQRSPWIPVSQAWAGTGFGTQIIPRAGMMVRLRYLYGDPDRPYVAGCLPTGINVLPSPPPELKARLTIRTQSLRAGGQDLEHFNEITLDDTPEREVVFIRAGRDYRRKVLNDERVEVDRDERRIVGRHQSLEVRGAREKIVDRDETILVKQKRTTLVSGDDERQVLGHDRLTVQHDQTIEIGGARATTVHGLDTGTFRGGRDEFVTGDDTLHVSQTLTSIADQAWRAVQGPTELVLESGDALLKAGGMITLEVEGARLRLEAGGRASLESNQKIALRCGEASIVMSPDKIEITAPEVQLEGANGSTKLDRSGVTTKGLTVSSSAHATNQITGAFVKAN